MVIDVHTHPLVLEPICNNEESLAFRREQFGLYKASPWPLDLYLSQMNEAGVDKSVLLPLDLSTRYNSKMVTNEEVKKLVDLAPERFIGFASVDPFDKDALDILDYAYTHLDLKGLKLNPAKQQFYPSDEILRPIYQKCIEHNKPIIFHAGMSWEPNALSEYAQPLKFEKVANDFPDLRICLAHFGWPWINETVMLLLKYPNVYTDTSLAYMDSPSEFLHHILSKNMGSYWLDRNFNKKVMFGTNNPRFRVDKMKQAVEKLPVRRTTIEDIFENNFMRFLG